MNSVLETTTCTDHVHPALYICHLWNYWLDFDEISYWWPTL